MLQTMRNMAQLWVFKALMLILVVSFGIWGIGDMFRGNPLQRSVVRVGDTDITVQDLNHEFQNTLMQARQSFGPELTADQARQLGFLDKTLDSMITRISVTQETKRLGINVTPQMVLEWVLRQPELHNKDGSFNTRMWQDMLSKHHMDEAHFVEAERDSFAQHELMFPFDVDSTPPNTITDLLVQARGQKRILDVISVDDGSIKDIAAPDDKALHDFYDKNPKNFTAPEYRALTIARLSLADIEKDITVTDDQAKKAYDANPSRFAYPERRDVLQVVVQDEARAKKIVEEARAGGNLPAAADKEGMKTVPLNKTEQQSLLPEIAKPVFDLKPDQVSDPVKSPLGWHIFQLKKITPPGTSSYDEVKDSLRETLKRDQAVDTETHLANQIDDELAAGHSLEDIADAMKLRLIKIPALDALGKTPDVKDPPELPNKDDVLKSGFGQGAGEVSPLIDDRQGNYLIVRTDEVTPSQVQPFDKVKDKVVAGWKAQEQAKRAAEEAETIAKGLRDGKTPASFAAQSGVDVRVSKPISALGDNDPAIPAAIYPQIMKMKKGEVIVQPLAGRHVVFRLAEFVDVKPDDKLAHDKVTEELAHETSKELVEEYLEYLHAVFPPKINQDALDSVVRQGG